MKWKFLNRKIITYSKNIFIPITNICRNKCSYCSFRRDIIENTSYLMNKNEVMELLTKNKDFKEVLFTFGEYPEYNQAYEALLENIGYKSTIDYVYDLSIEALKLGFLPHTNAGVLSYRDLKKLSSVNGSMGLMLESTNPYLEAHKESPGKIPKKRLKVIENAGKLKIPFTTGILVGIGESEKDIINSLKSISLLHKRYDHIQEVIIQNYKKGKPKRENNKFQLDLQEPSIHRMIHVIKLAKKILPNDISIQVPPNLIDIFSLLKYGVDDLGGISSASIDYINPENKWPDIKKLEKLLSNKKYILTERLSIYPKYIQKKWYSPKISNIVQKIM